MISPYKDRKRLSLRYTQKARIIAEGGIVAGFEMLHFHSSLQMRYQGG